MTVAAPVVVLALLGTVIQTRRAAIAIRYLGSTIDRGAAVGRGAPRVRCGLSVRKPGRMAFSYPLCALEVTDGALVVFGPHGRRLAVLTADTGEVELGRRIMWELRLRDRTSDVVLAVRNDGERLLRAWLSDKRSLGTGS